MAHFKFKLRVQNRENIPYLLLVPHGSFASHHDLAACLLLQLFRSHSTGTQDTTHKVELKIKRINQLVRKI